MSAVLLWAGLEKARAMAPFASALRDLGVPPRAAPVLAYTTVAAELSAALGLIFYPSVPLFTGVIGLAAAFACAGLVALLHHKRIACPCFGPYGARALGWKQLASFPVWIGCVTILWSQGAVVPDVARGWLLAIIALAMAGGRAATALRFAHIARGDRRSAREMYRWLNR
jgi:hypothetical protein